MSINALDLVRAVPEGTMFPKAAVIELLQKAGELEQGTPSQVAARLGRSVKYWREAAPTIDGAYQEESGRWYLPLAACRAHLARRTGKPRKLRGPYRKPNAVPKGKVLGGGLPVRRRLTVESARPQAPRLAISGSADNR